MCKCIFGHRLVYIDGWIERNSYVLIRIVCGIGRLKIYRFDLRVARLINEFILGLRFERARIMDKVTVSHSNV